MYPLLAVKKANPLVLPSTLLYYFDLSPGVVGTSIQKPMNLPRHLGLDFFALHSVASKFKFVTNREGT